MRHEDDWPYFRFYSLKNILGNLISVYYFWGLKGDCFGWHCMVLEGADDNV